MLKFVQGPNLAPPPPQKKEIPVWKRESWHKVQNPTPNQEAICIRYMLGEGK